MKKIFLLSGLPRSGSTLLSNILAQNPKIHATPTSGLIDILIPIKNGWGKIQAMKAMSEDQSLKMLKNTILGSINGFYSHIERPIVLDKSRAWPKYIEMLKEVLGSDNVKIIATVRDIRGILSSFEKLWRRTSALGTTTQEESLPGNFATLEQRCAVWADGNQPVGASFNVLGDAVNRGFAKDGTIHFVDFKDLTESPKSTMEKLYTFLELGEFKHDFNNVEQVTFEDDRIHGFRDLHTIRKKVAYPKPDWNDVLGKGLAEKYKKATNEFWSGL